MISTPARTPTKSVMFVERSMVTPVVPNPTLPPRCEKILFLSCACSPVIGSRSAQISIHFFMITRINVDEIKKAKSQSEIISPISISQRSFSVRYRRGYGYPSSSAYDHRQGVPWSTCWKNPSSAHHPLKCWLSPRVRRQGSSSWERSW